MINFQLNKNASAFVSNCFSKLNDLESINSYLQNQCGIVSFFDNEEDEINNSVNRSKEKDYYGHNYYNGYYYPYYHPNDLNNSKDMQNDNSKNMNYPAYQYPPYYYPYPYQYYDNYNFAENQSRCRKLFGRQSNSSSYYRSCIF